MSKFGVALQLPPTTSPPTPLLHSLSPLQLSACSIVRSYFACRKVAPKCCLSLPVVVLQLPSPAFAAIAACRRVALSHCRLAAWLVGILNNLPHACKFPLARHWALGDCRGRRHRRVRAASPTWSLSHISHAAQLLQQQQQQQTAQCQQQRLLATAVAMSTAYTSGLATTTGGVGRKLRSQVCPLA